MRSLRILAQLEMRIEVMLTNNIGLAGELHGSIGLTLSTFDALELGTIAAIPIVSDEK